MDIFGAKICISMNECHNIHKTKATDYVIEYRDHLFLLPLSEETERNGCPSLRCYIGLGVLINA